MFTKENGFALPGNWQFPDGKKYAFTFISLFIILLAIYSNSFYGEWHFDDYVNIVNNIGIINKMPLAIETIRVNRQQNN